MTLPGPQIIQRDTPPPRSAPTDVGVWFVAGLTEKGPEAPVEVSSLADYGKQLGDRVSYGALYDALETYFREGGHTAQVSRVLGPAAAVATANIFDQLGSVDPGDVSLVATANSKGEWGNALNVEVTVSGGDFTIIVSHDTDGVLETSPLLADRDAALAWAEGSEHIVLTLGASAEDPRVQGPTSLAGGTDDRANILDAHWLTALDRFGKDLGPGQVSYPGRTTTTAHTQVLAHARLRNRVALLDLADTADDATLRAAALALRPSVDARYGGAFAPWATIPGLTLGTTRTVPYSAVQAGLEARSAAAGNSANEPAAGENGQARYALGLSQPAWSDADRESLNDAGMNVARQVYGGVRTYGYRTLVDPLGNDRDWLALSNSRLYMQIAAEAEVIAERFQFRMIDGRKHTISEFGGELTGLLMDFYSGPERGGSLFGATPDEAFIVDVGDTVNTAATIAARELHAVLAVRMSPFAEMVIIEIAKVPVTESVA